MRSKISLLGFSLFALVFFAHIPPAHAATCQHAYTNSVAVPQGYGAAYDVFTPAVMLVSVDCTPAIPKLAVGGTNQSQYVYKIGYAYKGGAWQQVALTGPGALISSNWYATSAQGNLPYTAADLSAGWNYIVGYVCTWSGTAWKCGCADTMCTTGNWQLQAIEIPGGGGGGTCASGGRCYLNGVYANTNDAQTPQMMGYPWDYSIDYSYMGPDGGGPWLDNLQGYPDMYAIFHITTATPDFGAAAHGDYNGTYAQEVQNLVSHANQIYAIRIDHEFNGNWYTYSPYQNGYGSPSVDPATWIAGFRNLALMVRKYMPNTPIVWNPNGGPGDPWKFYPGDDVVDLIGPDIYCLSKYYATSQDCWNDWLGGGGGNNLTAYAAFSKQHNKPIVIPEWGDTFGDGFFINKMREWMDNNNVVAQSYWDSDDSIGPGKLSDSSDQQAYANAFGHRPYTGTYWPQVKPTPSGVLP